MGPYFDFFFIFSKKFSQLYSKDLKILYLLSRNGKKVQIFMFLRNFQLKFPKNGAISSKICHIWPKFDSRIFVRYYSRSQVGYEYVFEYEMSDTNSSKIVGVGSEM